MPSAWRLGPDRELPLDQPRIMAILNATPDSFFAGSRIDAERAAERAAGFVEAGAELLDVGGESTRPGAERVEPRAQIERAVPVIEAIRRMSGEPGRAAISIDTTRAEVARAALDAGANAINDVSGGSEDPELVRLAAARGCGLVLMHRVRPPERDKFSDQYDEDPISGDVVAHVRAALEARLEEATRAGVAPEAIVLDPGLGFGKSVTQNLELIRRTGELAAIGRPIMSAASRKSFVGRAALGRDSDPGERLAGSVAVSLAHAARGVRLFRVHDPASHAEALRMHMAIEEGRRWEPGPRQGPPTE